MFGARGQRGPLIFITLTVLLDAIGFGLIIPVMPQLIGELSHLPIDKAATVGGTLVMTYALAQFIFSPVVGGLSDRYGRRPVLLASMGGFALNMLITALSPVLWLLFLSRALGGVTGASYSTAYAYIADVTPPKERAGTYGLLGVAFGLGFILGPAIGGLLGGENVRAPFFVAAGMATMNMCIGYFFLPESLPTDRRRPFDIRRSNPIGSMRQLSRLGGPIKRLAAVYFLWMLAMQAMHGIWPFVASYRYSWTTFQVGTSLALMGLLAIIVNGLIVRRSVSWFGEGKTAMIGIASGMLGYMAQFLAETGSLAYMALTISALGGLTVPALQALMTERASASAQGELQGALATLSSFTVIIGPIIFSQMFTYFSGSDAPYHAPGAPFLFASVLCALALVTLMLARPERPIFPQDR